MGNITALENANFEHLGDHVSMRLIHEKFCIIILPRSLVINVYYRRDIGQTIPIRTMEAKNLKDAARLLYGYLDYYLDFTEKPKYDWETVWDKLLVADQELLIDVFDSIGETAKWHGMELITDSERKSMIAKLKLNIIIQQIDKDYPKTDKMRTGVIFVRNKELHTFEVQDFLAYKERIQTASIEGAKILLDQNTQLLQNLFKIETDD